MTDLRPREIIESDLATARAYRERSASRPSTNPLVLLMRAANESEIDDLEGELSLANSAALEMRFAGPAFEENTISVPLVSRILGSLQSTFRAAYRSLSSGEPVRRSEATLALSGTGPGSFRLFFNTPPAQLSLDADPPPVDQAMEGILNLLDAAGQGRTQETARPWAQTADEAYVRAMIRLSSTLAGAHAQTTIRWTPATQGERLVSLASEQALILATALAGQTGREILTVRGHLEMGQDTPPRVRIRTETDEYLAKASDDLLDQVKELLFDEVQATIAIDMRTIPTTGKPDQNIELLDIGEVQ